jgi:hypothetical protein
MPALAGGHFFSGRCEMADKPNQPDVPPTPPMPGKTQPIPPEMPPNELPVPEIQPPPAPHPSGLPGPIALTQW